jgi:hypothetical protein
MKIETFIKNLKIIEYEQNQRYICKYYMIQCDNENCMLCIQKILSYSKLQWIYLLNINDNWFLNFKFIIVIQDY